MMKEFLNRMILSLNSIEVKGKENLDTLLGCIQACESKLLEIQVGELLQPEEEVVEDGESVD